MITSRSSKIAITVMLMMTAAGLTGGLPLTRQISSLTIQPRYQGLAVFAGLVLFIYLAAFLGWSLSILRIRIRTRRLDAREAGLESLQKDLKALKNEVKHSPFEAADYILLAGGTALSVIGVFTAPVGGLPLAILGLGISGGDAFVKWKEREKDERLRERIDGLERKVALAQLEELEQNYTGGKGRKEP